MPYPGRQLQLKVICPCGLSVCYPEGDIDVPAGPRQLVDAQVVHIAAVPDVLQPAVQMLELLAQGATPVERIATETGLSIANTSQHLQTLKKARLVTSRKDGKYRYYELANNHVFRAWMELRQLGFSQNAQIDKLIRDFRTDPGTLECITTDDLLLRLRKRQAILLDVRPRQEYEQGHIASARSIPVRDLMDQLDDLPRDLEIVAYCRGPLCAMADDAVRLLRERGYRAGRLETGYPEWHAMGLPVEAGHSLSRN